jgi:hypothetical protein
MGLTSLPMDHDRGHVRTPATLCAIGLRRLRLHSRQAARKAPQLQDSTSESNTWNSCRWFFWTRYARYGVGASVHR